MAGNEAGGRIACISWPPVLTCSVASAGRSRKLVPCYCGMQEALVCGGQGEASGFCEEHLEAAPRATVLRVCPSSVTQEHSGSPATGQPTALWARRPVVGWWARWAPRPLSATVTTHPRATLRANPYADVWVGGASRMWRGSKMA